MFVHVTIHVADLAASERFYATVLAPLGIAAAHDAEGRVCWGDFRLVAASPGEPPTSGLHAGFVAPSHAAVDAFWRAGVEAGHRSDGEPGPRPQYRDDYYGGFLLDPGGNSAEAVVHGGLRSDGLVDHLWVRVADVAASRAFYDALAPAAGLRLVAQEPGLVRYRGPGDAGGSLTLLEGERPTANLHVALAADERATVLDPDGTRVELVA